MSALSLRPDETAVFYPFSISKGYLLQKDEADSAIKRLTFEIRLYVGLLLACSLTGYFFPSNASIILLFGVVIFCFVRYFFIISGLISGKPLIKERFKIRASLESSLMGHSYLSLSFLVISTAYLGWTAWSESSTEDTKALGALALFCWIFSTVHVGFIFWKRKIDR